MNIPDKNDMWVLLLSTVRYSLGRSTYMTSLAPELVEKYHEYLEEFQLRQVEREIVQELRMYRRMGKKISDHSTWLKWAMRLNRIRRKIKSLGVKRIV